MVADIYHSSSSSNSNRLHIDIQEDNGATSLSYLVLVTNIFYVKSAASECDATATLPIWLMGRRMPMIRFQADTINDYGKSLF